MSDIYLQLCLTGLRSDAYQAFAALSSHNAGQGNQLWLYSTLTNACQVLLVQWLSCGCSRQVKGCVRCPLLNSEGPLKTCKRPVHVPEILQQKIVLSAVYRCHHPAAIV